MAVAVKTYTNGDDEITLARHFSIYLVTHRANGDILSSSEHANEHDATLNLIERIIDLEMSFADECETSARHFITAVQSSALHVRELYGY